MKKKIGMGALAFFIGGALSVVVALLGTFIVFHIGESIGLLTVTPASDVHAEIFLYCILAVALMVLVPLSYLIIRGILRKEEPEILA